MWSKAVLAPALPGRSTPAKRLAALVQIGQQRAKPKSALEVARWAVLLRVHGDQRRVDVDHHPLGPSAGVPGVPAPPRASAAQPGRQLRVRGDRIDHPPRGGVRSDLTEQRLLIAHRAQVCQAVATVSQHHGPGRPPPGRDRARLAAPASPQARPTAPASAASSAAPACETGPLRPASLLPVKSRPSRCTSKVILPSIGNRDLLADPRRALERLDATSARALSVRAQP